MYNTFNMGIGFVMAVAKEDVGGVLESLIQAGERPYVIGVCLKGEKGVEFKW
jgi:phosphoribosylformylglycinamidine cyclo-ligase